MIPYNPIAGGLLSGKHRREAGPMPSTRFTHPTAGARYRDRYWHERELETVEALRPLAAEAGMSDGADWLSAWVLGESRHHGANRRREPPEQLDDALAAVDKGSRRGAQGASRRADARVPLGRRHPLIRRPSWRRVAILDDYQNVARRMADWASLPAGTEVVVFPDHLARSRRA